MVRVTWVAEQRVNVVLLRRWAWGRAASWFAAWQTTRWTPQHATLRIETKCWHIEPGLNKAGWLVRWFRLQADSSLSMVQLSWTVRGRAAMRGSYDDGLAACFLLASEGGVFPGFGAMKRPKNCRRVPARQILLGQAN